MKLVLLLSFCCGTLWPPQGIPPLQAVSPQTAPHVLGNGSIIIATDGAGRLLSCRWRGGVEQLGVKGAGWAFVEEGAGNPPVWLHATAPLETAPGDAEGFTLKSRYALAEREATCVLLLDPARPLLLAQLRLKKAASLPQPKLLWYQDFSPATGFVPGSELLPGVLRSSTDFAAFRASPGRIVVQFRPDRCGRAEGDRAKDLAQGGTGDWDRLGEGTWMATSVTAMAVREYFGAKTANEKDLLSRQRAIQPGATGDIESAFLTVGEHIGDEFVATACVAFGHDERSAREVLDYARNAGFEAIAAEAAAAARERLALAPPPPGGTPGTWNEDMLSLFTAGDATSGALNYAPPGGLAIPWASPDALPWQMLALDRAGQRERAGRLLFFYLDRLVIPPSEKWPAGALPMGLYADGTPAFPEFFLRSSGTAWLLAALLRHARELSPAERPPYFERVLPGATQAADFIASRVHAGTGDLLPEFQPSLLRDAATQESRLAAWMGLEAARRLHAEAGKTAPEIWAARQRELETQLRFQVLHAAAQEEVSPPLIAWLDANLPEQRSVWDPLRATGGEVIPVDALLEAEASRTEAAFPGNTLSASLRCLAAAARIYGGL